MLHPPKRLSVLHLHRTPHPSRPSLAVHVAVPFKPSVAQPPPLLINADTEMLREEGADLPHDTTAGHVRRVHRAPGSALMLRPSCKRPQPSKRLPTMCCSPHALRFPLSGSMVPPTQRLETVGAEDDVLRLAAAAARRSRRAACWLAPAPTLLLARCPAQMPHPERFSTLVTWLQHKLYALPMRAAINNQQPFARRAAAGGGGRCWAPHAPLRTLRPASLTRPRATEFQPPALLANPPYSVVTLLACQKKLDGGQAEARRQVDMRSGHAQQKGIMHGRRASRSTHTTSEEGVCLRDEAGDQWGGPRRGKRNGASGKEAQLRRRRQRGADAARSKPAYRRASGPRRPSKPLANTAHPCPQPTQPATYTATTRPQNLPPPPKLASYGHPRRAQPPRGC